MGHWCPTKSNYMGGWYFAAWKGKKEHYLPKKRSFIKSSQKKAQSLDGDRPNRRANSEIGHHIFAYTNVGSHLLSKFNVTVRHWIVLRKENIGI